MTKPADLSGAVQDVPEGAPADSALPAEPEEQAAPLSTGLDFQFGEAAAPDVTPAAVSDDLDEEVYATTVPDAGPRQGDVIGGLQLGQDLGRGWFTAAGPEGSEPGLLYVRPAPGWVGLAPHRLLPRWTALEGGYLVTDTAGEPVTGPLPAAEALPLWTELARLVFALDKQGYVLTDLEPGGLLRTEAGELRLRFPPRVARVGEGVEPLLREGYTPPEVQSGGPAQAVSGVYLLGAVLYSWLSGQPLPSEGVSALALSGLRVPGVPQLLHQALAPAPERLTPTALMDALRRLQQPAPASYRVTAATTVGLNVDRPLNEDAFGYVLRQVDAEGGQVTALRACVADGMGGMAAGEVASRAAVEGFLASVAPDMAARVWDANAALLQALSGQDGGCAFSGVQIEGAALQLGHVGDTRAYHASGGEVRQLTQDHSYVAAMVASGMMTPEQAATSPERNKVLRSLGSVRQPQEHYVHTLEAPLPLVPGSRVLLVSDGVWGEVPEEELHGLLLHEPDAQRVVDALIDLALDVGAPDNATALLIERVR
ncbi:protein phosphatase 2C domain-containing protein [Deinococcus sp. NW-56]|uniref:protein phosphatase 2C domain-containing protein n=1 Tax=Deinococcus sp. NW-56 TaxID=2080419 RepID=UPI000CF3EA47|nr:protein phosphatase 2C domain-containing protein [Deinococcus sp. NW-56]